MATVKLRNRWSCHNGDNFLPGESHRDTGNRSDVITGAGAASDETARGTALAASAVN